MGIPLTLSMSNIASTTPVLWLPSVVKLLSHRWRSLFLILGYYGPMFFTYFGQGSIKWKIVG